MALASSSYATDGWSATESPAGGPAPASIASVPRVLAADDRSGAFDPLRVLLDNEGYRVETASSPAAILDAIEAREFDAVLLDLGDAREGAARQEALDLVAQISGRDPSVPVIVMTPWGHADVAAEAVRLGARDFIEQPCDHARLLSIVRTQVELARTVREQQRLEAENRSLRPPLRPAFVADAPSMQPVVELIARVGPSEANVLITGESGTGKATIAHAIHAASPRGVKGLVTASAGGVPEAIFESELFGHVKGAFADATSDRLGAFELADGGALFIDEIANVPLNLQSKLLRVLEAGDFERVGSSRTSKVDVRIISATTANLPDEVAAGRFRQDLLFRLNTIEIALPPLRNRREDIAPLAHMFLRQHAARYRKPLDGFEPAALQALLAHTWPGNIRELDHAVERAVLMSRGPAIQAGDLGLRLDRDTASRIEEMSLEDVEAFLIKKALARFDGNVSQAAKALGLSRSALYRRLQRYGL